VTISHILVPVDLSEDSLEALRTGCEVAKQFSACLDMLHVVEPLPPSADLMLVNVYDDIRQDMQGELDKLPCSDLPLGSVRRIVRLGYAAQTITDFARNEGVDLIILGTRGRTGLAHLLMGSVAERVIRTAPCPVLVTRNKPKTSIPESLRLGTP
jgi:nucleotide-binding universal stress UspA family protein